MSSFDPIYFPGADVGIPFGSGIKIIAHCCNDIPAMGRGVARELYSRWPAVKASYLVDDYSKRLGHVGYIVVAPDVIVANCIGQHGITAVDGVPPIRYPALRIALTKVAEEAFRLNATVHLPFNIGCGLAGGDWDIVRPMIEKIFNKTQVYIYDKYCQNKDS